MNNYYKINIEERKKKKKGQFNGIEYSIEIINILTFF